MYVTITKSVTVCEVCVCVYANVPVCVCVCVYVCVYVCVCVVSEFSHSLLRRIAMHMIGQSPQSSIHS